MREAQIIMPRDNAQAIAHLRLRLLDTFGGYTQHEATGAWKAPDGKVHYDHHHVFTIAYEHTSFEVVRSIAREIGREADQQCVYVRNWFGEVELVACR